MMGTAQGDVCVVELPAPAWAKPTDERASMPHMSCELPTAEEEIFVKEVTYGRDGVLLRGILARPTSDAGINRPAIFVLHGGPNSDVPQTMRWLAEALARRGFIALSGTYREDPD